MQRTTEFSGFPTYYALRKRADSYRYVYKIFDNMQIMRLITTIIFFFILFTPFTAESNEEIALEGPAPISFLTLDSKLTLGDGITRLIGPHGMKRECFQAKDAFLVLEKNVVGKGYEIKSRIPTGFNKQQCNLISEHPKNKMSITVGTSKLSIEKKLSIELPGLLGTVRWNSKKMFKSIKYDVQTTAKFEFSNTDLVRLYVFTTITH